MEKGGDLIMDSSYIQYRTQMAQQAQMSQMGGGMGGPAPEGQYDFGETGEEGAEGGPSRMGELDSTMSQMALERSPSGERPEGRNTGRLSELDKLIADMKKKKGGKEEEMEKALVPKKKRSRRI
jgi:hypothetical protein